MMEKPIDKITKEDIESLVSAKTSERRTLDYKLQFPGNSDAEKREFLYDVSSFANATGGDLVFGIADERDASGKPTGLPASADGLKTSNASAEILRLYNVVRDGTDPRIPGIQWQTVEGFPNGPVIVMRIPKSWAGPHMVIHSGVSRFYSRNSTGKYPLDVGEIRTAFLAQAHLGERIRQFVVERVSRVAQGESAAPLSEGAKMLLHLVPVYSIDPTSVRDVTKDAAQLHEALQPMSGGSWGSRFNFDGVVASGVVKSYVQVFRSGIIEAGDSQSLQYQQSIPSIAFEEKVWNAAARYLHVQKKLELPLPIFLMVTLIGVKGFKLGLSAWVEMTLAETPGTIDRDILFLPEALIERFDVSVARTLRPTFDALWQACGFEESMNYDSDGNWKPHKN